ncbi:pyridoxamine 5'-phosphate oxidase family protein [Halosquirtibacter laminarini]|uniref:Pyridoxamine 5'-phosphate oxidase family protein n=1 Tax=Halosquirtibacter laminarini TaxID=3374600 RepID=A0AC61NPB3_9BACT|nr:pyridoxamine 5'-phosphate oxidase family protein [Prolixibacteraceae bacterium]
MGKVDQRFVDFIHEHHVMTLATCVNNMPWVANCFYTYDAEENIFIVTTDTKTKHGTQAIENSCVALSIVLETEKVGMIQGLQVSAKMECIEASMFSKYRLKYLKRFPYAVLKQSDLWIISPKQMKFTDNRLGFGKKLIWETEVLL